MSYVALVLKLRKLYGRKAQEQIAAHMNNGMALESACVANGCNPAALSQRTLKYWS